MKITLLVCLIFGGFLGLEPRDVPGNPLEEKIVPSADFGAWERSSTLDAVPPEGVWYGTNGTLETETRRYEYGYSKELASGDYDGLLLVVDPDSGEVLRTLDYETGYWETFLFMGEFGDGTFVLATARYYLSPGSSMIRKHDTRLVKVDAEGNILLEKSLPDIQEDFHSHGGRLIVRESRASTLATVYDEELEISALPTIPESVKGPFSYPFIGLATVNGEETPLIFLTGPGIYAVSIRHGTYEYAFSVRVEATLEGVEQGGEYGEAPTLTALGDLELDGEPFLSGTKVSIPGYHQLMIRGVNGYEQTIDFTVHPIVENLESGQEYATSRQIFANGADLWLDGEPFENGSTVWIAGDHLFTVTGVNGYVLHIPFSILPSVSGVEDGGVYEEPLTLIVNGDSSLDGKTLMAGSVEVTDPGDHELILWKGTERVQTLRFTIGSAEESAVVETTETAYPVVETGLGILVLVGLFLVLKKK